MGMGMASTRVQMLAKVVTSGLTDIEDTTRRAPKCNEQGWRRCRKISDSPGKGSLYSCRLGRRCRLSSKESTGESGQPAKRWGGPDMTGGGIML